MLPVSLLMKKIIKEFCNLSRSSDDTYNTEQILNMEKKIFQTLGFNLSKPLPIHFLRRFAKAADPLGDRQYMAAKYFMELASIDYELTPIKPSKVCRSDSFYQLPHVFISFRSPLHHSTSPCTFSTPSRATRTCGQTNSNTTALSHRRNLCL